MSWTPEKVEKLRELWGKGYTASQIAEKLGDTTRNAVIGKAHRLNLSAKIKKNLQKIQYQTLSSKTKSIFKILFHIHQQFSPSPTGMHVLDLAASSAIL